MLAATTGVVILLLSRQVIDRATEQAKIIKPSVFVGVSKQRANYAVRCAVIFWTIGRMSCVHGVKNVDVKECVIGDLFIYMDETLLFC